MCGKKSLPRFRRKPSFYTLEHSNSEAQQRIATYKNICKHWRLALDASFSCNSTQIIRDSRHFGIRCMCPQQCDFVFKGLNRALKTVPNAP